MALQQNIEIGNTGVTASYWRVTGIYADDDQRVVSVVLSGYLSQADRDAGKTALPGQQRVVIEGADYDAYVTTPIPAELNGLSVWDVNRSIAYGIVRDRHPLFADATDV